MSQRVLHIQVLFFARARELAGTDSTQVKLPADASVADALDQLARSYPELGKYLGSCRTALDEQFVPPNTPLVDDSVLAIIPPVSGGV